METSKMTSKGQVLIPKKIREEFGFKKGVPIAIIRSKQGVLLKPIDKNYYKQFIGILKNDLPTTKEYLKWKKEEQKLEDK